MCQTVPEFFNNLILKFSEDYWQCNIYLFKFQVHANDTDITTTTNGKVTYEIIQGQGNDAKLFQINTSSGEISKSAEWKGCIHLPRYVDIHVTASDNPSAVSMKRLTGLF